MLFSLRAARLYFRRSALSRYFRLPCSSNIKPLSRYFRSSRSLNTTPSLVGRDTEFPILVHGKKIVYDDNNKKIANGADGGNSSGFRVGRLCNQRSGISADDRCAK